MRATESPRSSQPLLERLLSFGRGEKCSIAFSKIGQQVSILAGIKYVRQELIAGLQSVKYDCGWHDPTEECAQSLWTCLEVCKSLLEAGEPIKNLDEILARIDRAKIPVGDLVGWESECLPGLISTYLTSDAGLLFLVLGQDTKLAAVLSTLQKMQNSDGGWGVCNGDSLSKTRPTSFVLRLYAKCLESPWAFSLLDMRPYVDSITWLDKARNDVEGGWGNLADTPPSNVSATAIALDALVSTKVAMQKQPDLRIPVHESVIRAGLHRMIKFGQKGRWRGSIEEFGIQIPGEHRALRHTASGMGTLVVTQVLAKSARLGYIFPEEPYLLHAVKDIIDRCQPYSLNQGRWIVPSDYGGPPTSWNSAFALDALSEFEQLYLDYLRNGVLEDRILETALGRARRWRQVSLVIAAFLGIIVLVPRLSFLSGVMVWFNSQSPWMQGIIMVFVTLAIERIVSIAGSLARSIFSKARTGTKED